MSDGSKGVIRGLSVHADPARLQELRALLEAHGFHGVAIGEATNDAADPGDGLGGDETGAVRLGHVRAAVDHAVHELNNAATAVSGNLIAIVAHRGGEPVLAGDHEAILSDCHEGQTRVVDVARRLRAAVAGLTKSPHGVLDLSAMLHREASLVTGAAMDVDVPPAVCVYAQQARLTAVMRAVFAAAAAHSGPVVDALPSVRVRLSEDGDQVCIRVDGDGPGLNYDISAVLMRDFFRVPGLTAPEDGNLAFAANFLAEFGGELRIEERPDQSRWFDLFLPVGTAASR